MNDGGAAQWLDASEDSLAMTRQEPIGRGRLFMEAGVVGFCVFCLYAIAAHQIAVGWDEGFTFDRLHLLERWFGNLWRTGDFAKQFSRESIERYWRFSKEEPDGHGPFYCLLSLASYQLTSGWVEPPACYRFGSIVLFSSMIGTVYATHRQRWDAWTAIVAVGLLASIPRVVPEVSFALIDGPLFSLSLLAWCAFVRSERLDLGPDIASSSARAILHAILFGVWIGLAMATKVTGWLLIGPYIAWAIFCRRGFKTVAVGVAVGAIVCLVLNVGWWTNPVDGVVRFWRSNLTREQSIPIGTLFLGTRYSFSLPWYNTAVWTLVANPVGLVGLGSVGIAWVLRNWRRDVFGLLLVLNWLLLMVVRALPKAPGHDGTRQIIVSFGFLALLAGYGLARLAMQPRNSNKVEIVPVWRRRLAISLGVIAVAESAVAVVRYHPLQLSYYSPVVGGLPGANRLGFEPTYFWDALTPDVLEWLNRETPPNGWVLFRNNPTSFGYLTRWGKLRVDHTPHFNPNPPPTFSSPPYWFVVQHRPGIFAPSDDWLLANARPVFEKRLNSVPLISIYSGVDWQQAQLSK